MKLIPGFTVKSGLIVAFFALFPTQLFGQTKPPVEQSIAGRALTEDGQPATGASVTAYSVGGQGTSYMAVCDETGNFKLAGLAPGSYRLTVEASGFVLESHSLADNVFRAGENVTVHLVRGGVITGQVTDSAGQPLVGVKVTAHRTRDSEGNRNLRDPYVRPSKTDDRGIYRIYGLEPGAYILGVEVDEGGGYGGRDVPTWHPSTTRAAATEVFVRAGDEVSNIDIRHRNDTGHAVSGRVLGETEGTSPVGNIGVTLFDAATKAFVAQDSANTDSKKFVLAGLPDGEYELFARSYLPNGESQVSALRHITIKSVDVTGIELKLARFGALSGRIVIERPSSAIGKSNDAIPIAKCEALNPSPNRLEEILIQAREEGRNPRALNTLLAENGWLDNRASPDSKGEFALGSLEASSYRLEFDLPGDGWYIRSITRPAPPAAGGVTKKLDAARAPMALKTSERLTGIEVTIAEGAASLNGRVAAVKEGQKLPPYLQIHLVPAEVTAADDVLRYAETLADKNGAFAIQHLAPGKYWLLARTVAETDVNKAVPHPASLDPIERARLRREAEAAKNEITLQPCQRAKDVTARFAVEK
jgi:hypothetical protein